MSCGSMYERFMCLSMLSLSLSFFLSLSLSREYRRQSWRSCRMCCRSLAWQCAIRSGGTRRSQWWLRTWTLLSTSKSTSNPPSIARGVSERLRVRVRTPLSHVVRNASAAGGNPECTHILETLCGRAKKVNPKPLVPTNMYSRTCCQMNVPLPLVRANLNGTDWDRLARAIASHASVRRRMFKSSRRRTARRPRSSSSVELCAGKKRLLVHVLRV